MKHWTVCLIVSLGMFANMLAAQDQLTGYHSVACIKIQPGKGAEYRQFVQDFSSKVMQASVDNGDLAAAYLLRTVIPSGQDARCDYVAVSVYKGAPTAPTGIAGLTKILQRAGLSISAADYIAKRGTMTQLVSAELWRNALQVGSLEKGDYLYVNFMKVHNATDWINLEQKIWKPMAEAWVKDGSMHGWNVNQLVLPAGTDLKYQGVSIDVFPSWDAAMKAQPVADTFKKLHPGMSLDATFDNLAKARDLARRELLVVEEKVAMKMTASQR